MNELLWSTEFDEPMPTGMTYMLFNQLAARRHLLDALDNTVSMIHQVDALEPSEHRSTWLRIELNTLGEINRRLSL